MPLCVQINSHNILIVDLSYLLLCSQGALPRLKALEKCRDGFRLAELDLQLRGPGHLLGKKQSGHVPEFAIARLDTDEDILNDARTAAEVGD